GLLNLRDQQIPAYQGRLDQVAQQLRDQVNALHTAGYGQDGVSGRAFFTGTGAAGLAVNPDLLADASHLAAADAPGQAGNSAVALAIAQLRDTANTAPQDLYRSLITAIGLDGQSADRSAERATVVVQQLMARREA